MHVCSCVCEHRYRQGRDVRYPGAGDTSGSAPPEWVLELNSGPLQRQNMLLTTEPSHKPQRSQLLKVNLLGVVMLVSALRNPRQVDLYKLEASLVYTKSSRPALTTLSKKKV